MHRPYVTPAKSGGSRARLGPESIYKLKYFTKSKVQWAVNIKISNPTYPRVGVSLRTKTDMWSYKGVGDPPGA